MKAFIFDDPKNKYAFTTNGVIEISGDDRPNLYDNGSPAEVQVPLKLRRVWKHHFKKEMTEYKGGIGCSALFYDPLEDVWFVITDEESQGSIFTIYDSDKYKETASYEDYVEGEYDHLIKGIKMRVRRVRKEA